MKKIFKKAVSLTIALSTVAALSVPAFADAVAEPSDSKDAVTVTGYETLGPGQYAVAVVPEGFIGADDSDIYYVNQADEGTIGTIIANMLLKDALEDGTYEVRIGTNATVDEGVDTLTTIKFTVGSASTDDFITSADTDKGTIKVDVATAIAAHSSSGMGPAAGCIVVSLALDKTAYPNAGGKTPAYSIAAVNADGSTVPGSTVFYSAERAKYVALIPSTATGYKFKVVPDGADNDVITKYGNINLDAKDQINATDFGQVRKIYKKGTGLVTEDNAKKALVGDVNGDGKINATDFGQVRKAYKGLDYTFKVLEK